MAQESGEGAGGASLCYPEIRRWMKSPPARRARSPRCAKSLASARRKLNALARGFSVSWRRSVELSESRDHPQQKRQAHYTSDDHGHAGNTDPSLALSPNRMEAKPNQHARARQEWQRRSSPPMPASSFSPAPRPCDGYKRLELHRGQWRCLSTCPSVRSACFIWLPIAPIAHLAIC